MTAGPSAPGPTLDPALEQAYRRAVYQIEYAAGHSLTRTIGQIDPAADVILKTRGCQQTWSIVTPCNPRSLRLDADANQAGLYAMRRELDTLGWRWLPALAGPTQITGDMADWIEPGFCVFDQARDAVVALAHRYQQLAVVYAQLGAAPELLLVRDPSVGGK